MAEVQNVVPTPSWAPYCLATYTAVAGQRAIAWSYVTCAAGAAANVCTYPSSSTAGMNPIPAVACQQHGGAGVAWISASNSTIFNLTGGVTYTFANMLFGDAGASSLSCNCKLVVEVFN